jgi:hypothetical protein
MTTITMIPTLSTCQKHVESCFHRLNNASSGVQPPREQQQQQQQPQYVTFLSFFYTLLHVDCAYGHQHLSPQRAPGKFFFFSFFLRYYLFRLLTHTATTPIDDAGYSTVEKMGPNDTGEWRRGQGQALKMRCVELQVCYSSSLLIIIYL